MINIYRLETRDIREGLPFVRKKAWVVEIFSVKFVVLWFSGKYFRLYDNYIKGLNSLYGLGKYRLLFRIDWRRLIIVNYIPGGKSEEYSKVFDQISNYLALINENGHKRKALPGLRYITLLIPVLENLTRDYSIIAEIKIIKKIITSQKRVVVGYGIDDPTYSNFIICNDECDLVDLDNFSESINYYYMLGYLSMDMWLEVTRSFNPPIDFPSSEDNLMYCLGRISRLSNLIINNVNNPAGNYGFDLDKSIALFKSECKVLRSSFKNRS